MASPHAHRAGLHAHDRAARPHHGDCFSQSKQSTRENLRGLSAPFYLAEEVREPCTRTAHALHPRMLRRNVYHALDYWCVQTCVRRFYLVISRIIRWERDWDSITTCSKRCNGARKQQDRQARRRGDLDSSDDESEEEAEVSSMDDASDPKAARKQAKKAAKAARRAVREGRAPEHGQKACDMCSRGVDLLIRCQVSANGQWQLVCGRCWKLPEVAGGVVDGDGSNPHYRYGGLWKNRAAAC